MKNLLLFLLLPIIWVLPVKESTEIISCATTSTKIVAAEQMHTVRDGDWFSGSTWNTGRVPAPTDNVDIRNFTTVNNRVLRIKGKLTSSTKKGGIKFINIDERRFVGSGMDVPDTDVGLVVTEEGQLQLEGDKKTSWTNAIGSVSKGVTSFRVQNASGWNVGDKIVIVPTDTPPSYLDNNTGDYLIQGLEWNNITNKPVDPFAEKFEELTITSITGNLISIAQALKYDHLEVIATGGARKWTAEVMNLTRSFVIEGTEQGRAHVFIRSNKPQHVSYVENRFTGPRKKEVKGGKIEGRYPWHMHHNMDASRGSVFEGVSTHHTGNHAYVFHRSFGVTARNSIGYHTMNTPFWWDFQEDSRDIVYDRNIAARVNYNGVENNSGFYIGSSDNNVAINNVAVYAHNGNPHQQGGFVWFANDEGEWEFTGNLSHSNCSGFFTWQNSNRRHFIENYDSYNNVLGGQLGAYGNTYVFRGGYHYRSPWHTEATQDNTNPHWTDVTFDAGGRDYGLKFLSSPFTANDLKTNTFVRCVFKGHAKTPIFISTQFFKNENGKKIVWLIDPVIEGVQPSVSNVFASGSMYGSQLVVQKGNSATLYEQSGIKTIAATKPRVWGTGMGLIQQIYNDPNFQNEVVKRKITQVKDGQLSFDRDRSITGVHYKVTSDAFSMRYSGFIEPQYSEPTYFEAKSAGGVRLWIDGKLILDRWNDDNDPDPWKTSSVINLEVGKRYAFRFEHVNTGGRRGVELYWRSTSIPQGTMIPQTQFYTGDATTPTDPIPVNNPPTVNAGADITITDTFALLAGVVTDDKPGVSGTWSRVSGPSEVKFEPQSDFWRTRISGLRTGTYVFRLSAKDAEGLTASDQVTLSVIPPVTKPIDSTALKAFAGNDTTVTPRDWRDRSFKLNGSRSTGSIHSYRWDYISGPKKPNWEDQNLVNPYLNDLVTGIYTLRLTVTGTNGTKNADDIVITVATAPAVLFRNAARTDSVTCIDGTKLIHTVPAGKHSAASQSAADALAIQEINVALSNCPKPIAELKHEGKTVYVFFENGNYKLVVKEWK